MEKCNLEKLVIVKSDGLKIVKITRFDNNFLCI